MFVENSPIPNLNILNYCSERDGAEEEEIITAFASCYRTLSSVTLVAAFDSSVSLLKVVKCCRCLERLVFGGVGVGVELYRSDVLAVASLPRLKSLIIGGCLIAYYSFYGFVRCTGLKELQVPYFSDLTVLASIGMNLVSLNLLNPSEEVVNGIVEHCPNLQYLELDVEFDEEVMEGLVVSLKNGLKRLVKLKLDGKSMRLGTDWEGYHE
jgi:hypothetical protein